MGPRSAAAEAALDRAERAAQQAVRRAGTRGEDFLEAESPGNVHAVRLLRASSQLRAHTGLHDLRKAQEKHLDSLDRRMREIECTRELVAKALRESSEPSQLSGHGPRDPQAAWQPVRLQNTRGVAAEGLAKEQPKRIPTRTEAIPAVRSDSERPLARQVQGQCRLVELRPAPCPPGVEGQDCPCCLAAMEAGQPVLAFPCTAPHHFHARCLERWLRSSSGRSTCPVCRGWPRGRRASMPADQRVVPALR